MDSQWKEKRLYPMLSIFIIFTFIYLNFNEQLDITFPVIVWNLPIMSFVGVNQTRFMIMEKGSKESTKHVYVNGWNSYWLMDESAQDRSSRKVTDMMKKGSEIGLTVCRTWAFNDGPGTNTLQVRPGVFNERVFKALDYVIVEARRNRIRLILSLVNNLDAYGGKAQYVSWVKESGVNVSGNDSFFSDPVVKGYYKAYVKAIVNRKNYYTGIRYLEEPAIFAWELMNEPRCESASSATNLQDWISEMAAFVKCLDQKHLVTVGTEGFYGSKLTESSVTNPGEWAASLGLDFITNSAVKDIDFASVHAYPDSWIPDADLEAKVKYLSNWADAHISDSEKVLKKPVLFTEVGAPLTIKTGKSDDRDTLLKTVYDKIYKSAEKNEAGAGVLIWQLLVEGVEEYSDKYSFIASKYPSTYKLILEQSCKLQNMSPEEIKNRKILVKDLCFG